MDDAAGSTLNPAQRQLDHSKNRTETSTTQTRPNGHRDLPQTSRNQEVGTDLKPIWIRKMRGPDRFMIRAETETEQPEPKTQTHRREPERKREGIVPNHRRAAKGSNIDLPSSQRANGLSSSPPKSGFVLVLVLVAVVVVVVVGFKWWGSDVKTCSIMQQANGSGNSLGPWLYKRVIRRRK